MLNEATQKKMRARLRKIAGQVEGITHDRRRPLLRRCVAPVTHGTEPTKTPRPNQIRGTREPTESNAPGRYAG